MTNKPDFNNVFSPPDEVEAVVLDLQISPTGHIHLGHIAGHSSLSPLEVTGITKAFERGSGDGLLHLLTVKRASELLPPSLVFGYQLAHLFMRGLCAVPNLASQWDHVEIALPVVELQQRVVTAPPMVGAEYLDIPRLTMIWLDLQTAARTEIAATQGDVQAWLQCKHPSWNLIGRVCFHLAENKNHEQAPFAFLATYAAGVSQQSRVQYQPLRQALQEYAGAGNHDMLLRLLQPVNKAAEQSPWIKSLLDSGTLFHPIAWTPAKAHQFLRHIPIFESCGIVVRIPDWWQVRQPPRPQVKVNIGNSVAGLGLNAMLDFDVSLSLDGEEISLAEWKQLLTMSDGLVQLKGRWIELDRKKLESVLEHWKKVQRDAANGNISFIDGMRLLAGAAVEGKSEVALLPDAADWSNVVAGNGLQQALEGLRDPHNIADDLHLGDELQVQLRPYQKEGVRWLWLLNRLGLGGCLADDMGLGKTVQILALLLLAKREGDVKPHLLVLPTSLIGNWQSEITRFAPGLSILIAHPSAIPSEALNALPAECLENVDVVITSYGSLIRLPWLLQTSWSLVVLDEAQAIKNPTAYQTKAAKALKSRVRFVLTGTPVENRLGDLWSLFDFICPGLLGSSKAFSLFIRRLAQDKQQGYAPLRNLVKPYILRRMKSDKRIIADLPDKTEVKTYCVLSRLQASLYGQAIATLVQQIDKVEGIARRGLVLAFLMRFKQICNHPSQWLGDEAYLENNSGKFVRLRELAQDIAARQEKVLVFTQFKEMTAPLAAFLQDIFGCAGLQLHGGIAVKTRKALVDKFQQETGPPFFVLSIKAGGTGLNLTAASHVIHFDRWWNPAVENQATDRAYRIGQKKNVLVHKFICRGTIEERIDTMIENKIGLSNDLLAGGGETLLTEMSNEALLKLVSLDINSTVAEEK
ncbi:DEAD/DEAH box helicase [Candidatus Fukatsuia symbiotica]|uniref:DEAD/DEAH box helicase n=1 Tax=Candidatus Fukatsuia TaxID=1927833 RepID=UPI000933E444|nr:DEAD/DEAH box helicase [Candidatus Fukatsuia symbiotica]MEA9445465.1 DEAD/DEAH box helicase [Candidatus Fukatsuia symbiotica]